MEILFTQGILQSRREIFLVNDYDGVTTLEDVDYAGSVAL